MIKIPRFVRYLASAILVLFLLPVASEFSIEWAREQGVYDHPSAKVNSAMDWLASLTSDPWFWPSLGFVAGVAIALWIIKIFPENAEWTNSAHLRLVFDNELSHATADIQENIRFHYWYNLQNMRINMTTGENTLEPGHVIVFVSLKYPTYTNNKRARVIGGGVASEFLGDHAAGAVVRFNGDLRGRTVDIQFSKDPIPLD